MTTEPSTQPPSDDPVTSDLLDWIAEQSRRMVGFVEGLDEEQLRARPLPSGWSMLGLLAHVRDTTRFWLHDVLLGHPSPMDDDDVWENDPAPTAAAVVADLHATTETSVAAARGLNCEQPPAWWPEGAWGGYRQDTVRGVLLHLLAENAAHAGHLAIARELTDGGVWDYAVGGVRVPSEHAPRD